MRYSRFLGPSLVSSLAASILLANWVQGHALVTFGTFMEAGAAVEKDGQPGSLRERLRERREALREQRGRSRDGGLSSPPLAARREEMRERTESLAREIRERLERQLRGWQQGAEKQEGANLPPLARTPAGPPLSAPGPSFAAPNTQGPRATPLPQLPPATTQTSPRSLPGKNAPKDTAPAEPGLMGPELVPPEIAQPGSNTGSVPGDNISPVNGGVPGAGNQSAPQPPAFSSTNSASGLQAGASSAGQEQLKTDRPGGGGTGFSGFFSGVNQLFGKAGTGSPAKSGETETPSPQADQKHSASPAATDTKRGLSDIRREILSRQQTSR